MASQTNPRSRLYALLVAINNYLPPIPALRGCVNDLQKVASYLEKESKDFDLHIHKLIDSQATKDNIVNAFTRHFEPAGSGDVIFLYFSGHGTQEEADPVFWSVEEDHKLESLVCYDGYMVSEGRPKFRLLADKELRFMIGNVAKKGAHVLTIFDCCHSGGNVRNGLVVDHDVDVRERRFVCRERLSQAFPLRAWNEFIFSDTISLDDVKKNSLDHCLPEGKHIQMAACQHDESAFELEGEGVFTKNLLEILTRCEGSVSYYDLQSRIQNYLRYQFKQTPKAYVVGDDESALFLGFLNKKGGSKPLYGNINFNKTDGWVIDFGAMHGVSQESVIKVVADNSSEICVSKVKEVYATHSQLQFEKQDRDKLEEHLSYKGYSDGYFFALLRVCININDSGIKRDLKSSLSSSSAKNLIEVKGESDADYCIELQDSKIFVSKPLMPLVPVVRPVDFIPEQSALIVRNYLQHLSQFEFVKRLENQNSFLFGKFPIEICFYQKNVQQIEEEIPIKEGEVVPKFVKDASGSQTGSVRIKLKNASDRKLYCALLYLTFNFGVITKLLKEVVVKLDPNAEVWALDGSYIGLKLEEEVLKYNYRESLSTLKLMVSTTDFKQQVARFEMPALPGPLSAGDKGFDISPKGHVPEIQDWTMRNIDIKIKNPDFKT
jgi:hypothetical protein